jgi:hypothetical protein
VAFDMYEDTIKDEPETCLWSANFAVAWGRLDRALQNYWGDRDGVAEKTDGRTLGRNPRLSVVRKHRWGHSDPTWIKAGTAFAKDSLIHDRGKAGTGEDRVGRSRTPQTSAIALAKGTSHLASPRTLGRPNPTPLKGTQ